MTFWTADNLKTASGGVWVARPPQLLTGALEGLSTDSRSIRAGQVFLALRGENFDGHLFLKDAVEGGSPLLIVEDADAHIPKGGFERPVGILKVSDTRRALARLAAAYRKTFHTTKVIAVCGSNGKTTTTRLIHAILSTRLRGTCPKKSFNNDIGVPLTILAAREGDQYLICEVGTNAPGEIAALSAIVEPDIAVITSIGREHLEKLGSIEGVAKEEAAVLGSLRPGGLAVVTADAPELTEHIRAVAAVTFGKSEKADLRLTAFEHAREDGKTVIRFEVNKRWSYSAPLLGEHNALNALAAIAVARRLAIDDAGIAAGLAEAVGPEMRMQPRTLHGVEIINDAYNANPDSVLAALKTFSQVGALAPRRVLILGDMLEQGPAAPDAHREVADSILATPGIDLLICIGHLAMYTAERVARKWGETRVLTFPDLNDGRAAGVAALLHPADSVLLKASRGMRLERIPEALAKQPHAAPLLRPESPTLTKQPTAN